MFHSPENALHKIAGSVPNPKSRIKNNKVTGTFVNDSKIQNQIISVIKNCLGTKTGAGVEHGNYQEEKEIVAVAKNGLQKAKASAHIYFHTKPHLEDFYTALKSTGTTSDLEKTHSLIVELLKDVSDLEVELLGLEHEIKEVDLFLGQVSNETHKSTETKSDALAVSITLAHRLTSLNQKLTKINDCKESLLEVLKVQPEHLKKVAEKIISSFTKKSTDVVAGGAVAIGRVDEEKDERGDRLEKRLSDKQKSVKKIIESFISDISSKFTSINESIIDLSKHVSIDGMKYAPNASLNEFAKHMKLLAPHQNVSNYISMIDIKTTNTSMADKELMMDNLKLSSEYLTKIMSDQTVDIKQLRSIKESINDIIRITDNYTNEVKASRGEIKKLEEGGDPRHRLGGTSEVDIVSLLDEAVLTINLPNESLLDKSLKVLDFQLVLWKMQNNMKYTHADIAEYSKSYPDLLGKSIGVKINNIRRDKENFVDSMKDNEEELGALINLYNKVIRESAVVDADNMEINKDNLLTISNWQFEVRENFYRTVEAIDLFLMNFTLDVSKNPYALKDLNEIMKSTQVISEWYNADGASQSIKSIFNIVTDDAGPVPLPPDNVLKLINDSLFTAIKKQKKIMQSVVSVKNIVSILVYMNGMAKDKLLLSASAIHKNIMNYICASSFVTYINNEVLSNEKTYISKLVTKLSDDSSGASREQIQQLKIYLVKKLLACKMASNNIEIHKFKPDEVDFSSDDILRIDDRVEATNKVKALASDMLKQINGKTINMFEHDDKYFVLLLKAIVGKIFTTVGVYKIFNEKTSIPIIKNPVRVIMGGASSSVSINSNTFELYVRLPLIIEFYKRLFADTDVADSGADETLKKRNETISFIPDMTGVWSNLITIIFEQSKYVTDGVYSDDIIHKIIEEVNKVYKYYQRDNSNKSVDDLTHLIIMNLVSEVNRRYGILKRDSIKKYYNVNNTYSYDNPLIKEDDILTSSSIVYKNILGNESDKSVAPSDKFLKSNQEKKDLTLSKLARKSKTFVDDLPVIKEFQKKFSTQFANFEIGADETKLYLNDFIKKYKLQLSKVTDDKEKVIIVVNAIKNLSTNPKSALDTYVLFHETVLYPLTLLGRLYQEYNFAVRYVYTVASNSLTGIPAGVESKIKRVVELIDKRFTDATAKRNQILSGVLYNDKNTYFNLIERVQTLNNGLTKLELDDDNKIIFDFTELENSVSSMITMVKSNISKFRRELPSTLIDVLLKPNDDDLKFNVTDLENKFLNNMIRNNFNDGKKTSLTLTDLTQLLGDLVSEFKNVELARLPDDGKFFKEFPNNVLFGKSALRIDTLFVGDNISQKENLTLQNSKILPCTFDAFKRYDISNKRWIPRDIRIASGGNSGIRASLKKKLDELIYPSDDTGLLDNFNRTLLQYVNNFYDPSNKKYYGKLTGTLYNDYIVTSQGGYLSCGILPVTSAEKEVLLFNTNSPNRDNTYIEGSVLLPKTGSIISNTNMHTISTMNTRMLSPSNPSIQGKFHLLEDISEVTNHTLQRFSSDLPRYKEMFETILNKALVYKKLFSSVRSKDAFKNTNIEYLSVITAKTEDTQKRALEQYKTSFMVNMLSSYQSSLLDDSGSPILYTDLDLIYNGVNSPVFDVRMSSLIDELILCSRMIINDIDLVVSEVNVMNVSTIPFEIQSKFVQNYILNYKTAPFALPSFASRLVSGTTLVSNSVNVDKSKLITLPTKQTPSYETKLITAFKAVLDKDRLNLIELPFISKLVNTHNSSNYEYNQLEDKKLLECINQSLHVVKCLYKGSLIHSINSNIPVETPVGVDDVNKEISVKNSEYNVITKLDNVILSQYMQDSNIKQIKQNIILPITLLSEAGGDIVLRTGRVLEDGDLEKRRNMAQIQNIIELNIVPINIHSMMKEIPLTNIYNYSFIYDMVVDNMYKEEDDADGDKYNAFKMFLKEPHRLIKDGGDLGAGENKKEDLLSAMTDARLKTYNKFFKTVIDDNVLASIDASGHETVINTKLITNLTYTVALHKIVISAIKDSTNLLLKDIDIAKGADEFKMVDE